MVSLRSIIPIAIVGAVIAAVVYFRKPIGETGQAIGQGLSGIAQGISDIGGGIGSGFGSTFGGIGAGISSLFSPFGLAQGYQQAAYTPYNQNAYVQHAQAEFQNSNGDMSRGNTSSGQDITVTPATREYSDVPASLKLVQATGNQVVQAFHSALANAPRQAHPAMVREITSKTGLPTPYAVFVQTRAAARSSGLSVQDAFHFALGVLKR